MAKQRIEVEIDVPEGKRVKDVAFFGNMLISVPNLIRPMFTVELEPAFDLKAWWPEWLKAEWIAMDDDGLWYAHEEKPVFSRHGDHWNSMKGYSQINNLWLWMLGLDFTPPPNITDWKQSLLANPHTEQAKRGA